MIRQNLAGNPTARHNTGIAGHKNLRASTGAPFAKPGEPFDSHGNANVGFGNGVAELLYQQPLIPPVKLLEHVGEPPKGLGFFVP